MPRPAIGLRPSSRPVDRFMKVATMTQCGRSIFGASATRPVANNPQSKAIAIVIFICASNVRSGAAASVLPFPCMPPACQSRHRVTAGYLSIHSIAMSGNEIESDCAVCTGLIFVSKVAIPVTLGAGTMVPTRWTVVDGNPRQVAGYTIVRQFRWRSYDECQHGSTRRSVH